MQTLNLYYQKNYKYNKDIKTVRENRKKEEEIDYIKKINLNISLSCSNVAYNFDLQASVCNCFSFIAASVDSRMRFSLFKTF